MILPLNITFGCHTFCSLIQAGTAVCVTGLLVTTGGGTDNSSLIQAGTAVCVTGLLVTTGGGTDNSSLIQAGTAVCVTGLLVTTGGGTDISLNTGWNSCLCNRTAGDNWRWYSQQ